MPRHIGLYMDAPFNVMAPARRARMGHCHGIRKVAGMPAGRWSTPAASASSPCFRAAEAATVAAYVQCWLLSNCWPSGLGAGGGSTGSPHSCQLASRAGRLGDTGAVGGTARALRCLPPDLAGPFQPA